MQFKSSFCLGLFQFWSRFNHDFVHIQSMYIQYMSVLGHFNLVLVYFQSCFKVQFRFSFRRQAQRLIFGYNSGNFRGWELQMSNNKACLHGTKYPRQNWDFAHLDPSIFNGLSKVQTLRFNMALMILTFALRCWCDPARPQNASYCIIFKVAPLPYDLMRPYG